MRTIGQLPDQAGAQTFSDCLMVQGIPNQIEVEGGLWTVWIHDDDHLGRAQALLEEFRLNPGERKFRQAASEAGRLRQRARREAAAWRKRFVSRQQLWQGLAWRLGWLTATLVSVCVAVSLFKVIRGEDAVIRSLFITDYEVQGLMLVWTTGLPEIWAGQVWRLITPIFLHFGPLHLLFNALWLLDLGGLIEARQGSGRLATLVVVIAALSNLGQYLVGGPAFGGMSGVVYGLFGYVWLRGRFDPGCGLHIDRTNATLMVVWFFACLSGWVGPVANTAHGVGFGLGLAWGFLSARFRRRA